MKIFLRRLCCYERSPGPFSGEKKEGNGGEVPLLTWRTGALECRGSNVWGHMIVPANFAGILLAKLQ